MKYKNVKWLRFIQIAILVSCILILGLFSCLKLSEFDLDELKVQINELLEVVKTGNKEMIKKGIRKIVPTYTITEITSNNINKDEAAITEQGED